MTILSVGFWRNFECATRESDSLFLIGGMLIFVGIAVIFSLYKSFDRYMTGVIFFPSAAIGVLLGALTLALVKDVCPS